MKEKREKLEITIVALGDVLDENEDEIDEEDKQSVIFNEIGDTNGETNVEGKPPENNLSLELQKLGYDAEDADLLLELLPDTRLEEQNENLLPEENELYNNPKDKMISQATKDMRARKVKFNEELCRPRQPRLCEIHKNSFDKLLLSNKPLIIANEQPISSKDSVNGEENEIHNSKANTNGEITPPQQGKRVPVKMRSVNMFNYVLPSSLLKSAPGVNNKSSSSTSTFASNANGGRSRVIPVWIKSKYVRKRIDISKSQSADKNIDVIKPVAYDCQIISR